jgi:hypothetical protein
MVGWWLWGLQQLSSHPLMLRLPAVLLWIAVTFGMMDLYARLMPSHAERRWLLGSLFIALPFTWAFNLITTDTPLILFLFFSGYAFVRAEIEQRRRWYVASGILLGLALLSKYFAGLLAITFAVYLLSRRGGVPRLIVVALCALPFMLLNLAWNASHCWNNILFNLINRNQDAHFSIWQVGLYLLMLLYLVTPWTMFHLWRSFRKNIAQSQSDQSPGGDTSADESLSEHVKRRNASPPNNVTARTNTHTSSVIAALFVIPLFLFLLLSFRKQIGLHWLLAFMPFVFLYAGIKLQDVALQTGYRWNLWLSLPHLLLLLGLIYVPTSSFHGLKLQTDLSIHRDGGRIVNALREDVSPQTSLMTNSYSMSSLLSYSSQTYIPVFGFGSFHARFDDSVTDFSKLDGTNIRIVASRAISQDQIKPFFEHVTVQERIVHGAKLWVADGEHFQFEIYRNEVLTKIADQYYRIPDWLPLYGCQFLQKYEFI